MISVIINLFGLAIIAGIIWWFWLSDTTVTTHATAEIVDVKVDAGVYLPATLYAKQGDILKIRFLRKDPSPCAEVVAFPDLGISQELAINKPVIMAIPTNKVGEFEFSCAMGMYHGKLIIT